MPSAVAWLTKTWRTELGASVSEVATLMPCVLRLLQQRRHRVGVVGRDDQRVDLLLDVGA